MIKVYLIQDLKYTIDLVNCLLTYYLFDYSIKSYLMQ